MGTTDELAEGLRPRLDELQAEEEQVEAQLRAVREARRRVESAIRALTGESKLSGRPKGKQWQPSQEKIDAVRAFVEAHPDGVTVPQTVEAGIASKPTADRVLRFLRDREEIRLAGKRGMAMLYKPLQTRGGMNGG